MNVAELHPWNLSAAEARAIQEQLRERIQTIDSVDPAGIRSVAGVDNSYTRDGIATTAHAVAVILGFPALEVVETAFASRPVEFPYVPGLLTFREGPAVLEAFRKLSRIPDVVLFDGQGFAHQRRFGLASHLGVILDLPSVGCAKSRLVGRFREPLQEFGAWTPLVDKGEQIGAAVRTGPGHAPLFVSIGTKLTLDTAVELVLACCREGRFMPEPTRLAHNLVTDYRKRQQLDSRI